MAYSNPSWSKAKLLMASLEFPEADGAMSDTTALKYCLLFWRRNSETTLCTRLCSNRSTCLMVTPGMGCTTCVSKAKTVFAPDNCEET